jgi:mRNA interferase RelE/StbE
MTPRKHSKTARGDIPSKKPPENSVWTIEILDKALTQIGGFDAITQKKIFKFLDRLPNYPSPRSVGEALTAGLAGFWKYRVGDYRLVCQIVDQRLVIIVAKAGNRRDVYR